VRKQEKFALAEANDIRTGNARLYRYAL